MGMPKTDEGREVRQRLITYLRQHQTDHGYLPSIAAMGRELDMNPNGVKYHLHVLREEKLVDYDSAQMSRSLRLKRVKA
jgi:predicted ArsR family transcriptional regulator